MKTKSSETLVVITMSSLLIATTLTGCAAAPDQRSERDKEKEKDKEQQTSSGAYHGGHWSGGRQGYACGFKSSTSSPNRTAKAASGTSTAPSGVWNWGWFGSNQGTASGTTHVGGAAASSRAFSSAGRAVGTVSRGGFGWGGFFSGG